MATPLPNPEFQITDLASSLEFGEGFSPVRAETSPSALQHMAQLLTRAPGQALHDLADTACELCHADSAGICVEEQPITAESGSVRVLAATGTFRTMSGVEVPRARSACAVAIEQQRAQRFQFPLRFFAEMNESIAVSDGITVPWSHGHTRGTIWMLTQKTGHTFTPADYQVLLTLADFAAIAHRNAQQQESTRREAAAVASSAMAHTLAHHINNPLQSITNSIYLALYNKDSEGRQRHLEQASEDLRGLSQLVGDLLMLHHPLQQADASLSAL